MTYSRETMLQIGKLYADTERFTMRQALEHWRTIIKPLGIDEDRIVDVVSTHLKRGETVGKITGYRELNDEEIALINEVKAVGSTIEDLVRVIESRLDVDRRWVSIGRTHLQEGLMALARSIAKPTSF